MADGARVSSVEAVVSLKLGLVQFHEEGGRAVDGILAELGRAVGWLDATRTAWAQRLREAQERVSQAKQDLARRKMQRMTGREPDTTEQEKALRMAVRDVEEAEAKLAACRRWAVNLQQALSEHQGPIRRLSGVISGELPDVIAKMEQRIRALEKYLDA